MYLSFVRKFPVYLMILGIPASIMGQNKTENDSLIPKWLDTVTVKSFLLNISPQPLPPVENVYIYSGKKTISLKPDANRANLAANVARMAFAQIPGLNIWEMDGAARRRPFVLCLAGSENIKSFRLTVDGNHV